MGCGSSKDFKVPEDFTARARGVEIEGMLYALEEKMAENGFQSPTGDRLLGCYESFEHLDKLGHGFITGEDIESMEVGDKHLASALLEMMMDENMAFDGKATFKAIATTLEGYVEGEDLPDLPEIDHTLKRNSSLEPTVVTFGEYVDFWQGFAALQLNDEKMLGLMKMWCMASEDNASAESATKMQDLVLTQTNLEHLLVAAGFGDPEECKKGAEALIAVCGKEVPSNSSQPAMIDSMLFRAIFSAVDPHVQASVVLPLAGPAERDYLNFEQAEENEVISLEHHDHE